MVKDTRILDDGTTLELVNLLDPKANKLYGASSEQLAAALAHNRLADIRGEFATAALVPDENGRVMFRGARTIGVPARVVRQTLTSTHKRLIVAHTIREALEWWERDLPSGIGPVRPPSALYTAMLLAFRSVTIRPEAWDAEWKTRWFLPGPEFARYPAADLLPADLAVIGKRLIETLGQVIADQLALIPEKKAIIVTFSGGADSTSVLATLLETLRAHGRTNPVHAVTLSIDGGGSDRAQATTIARRIAEKYSPIFTFTPIEVESRSLTVAALQDEAAMCIENYRQRDVECAMAGIVLWRGIMKAIRCHEILILEPAPVRHVEFNGDGNNEGWGDYPLEDKGYGRITLKEVLANPFLYLFGHAPGTHHHSPVFSDGLSRAYTRTSNPARANGVTTFSPYIDSRFLDIYQRQPLAEFARMGADLYALRPEAVRLGLAQVYGLDLPAFPKARFQEGCAANPRVLHVGPEDEKRLRRLVLT